MADEKQGMSKCPRCDKDFYGGGEEELCFACWLIENPPQDSLLEPVQDTGAGGWNYYRQPNIVTEMPRSDVLDYLAGCPRSRSIWFDVLHNSATPNANGIAVVRSFQQYHMSRGWSDIGYHFVVTTDGTIYLGRNLAHQGAHAFAEGNRGSMGYCLVGNFSGTGGLPSAAQISSAGFLARAVGATFGYNQHTGHRWTADPNIPSHATSCPGTNVSLDMVKAWTAGKQEVEISREEVEDMTFGPTKDPVHLPAWLSKNQKCYIDVTNPGEKDLRIRLTFRRDNGDMVTPDKYKESTIKPETTWRTEAGELWGVPTIGGITVKVERLDGPAMLVTRTQT